MLLRKTILLSFLLLLGLGNVFSQGTNPFQIGDKIEKETPHNINSNDVNPFVIKPRKNIEHAIKKESKNIVNKNIFFILSTILLVIFSILVVAFRDDFGVLYLSFTSQNHLSNSYRKKGYKVPIKYWVLYIIFFLSISIFTFISLSKYNVIENSYVIFFKILLGISLFILVKHFLIKISGTLLGQVKDFGLYNYTLIIFNTVIGIVLVPLVFILANSNIAFFKIIFFSSLAIIMLLLLFLLLRSLMLGMKNLILHKFHFFIYLCTLEIAPILIIYRYLSGF